MDYWLLNKFANNKCCDNEVDNVLNWIQMSEDEHSREAIFRQYWNTINPLSVADNEHEQNRLDKIHHRININQSVNFFSGRISTLRFERKYWLQMSKRIAAVVLLPVITLLIYTRFFQQKYIADIEISSPPTSRTSLVLPDGTKVWLNHDTKFIYPQKFIGNVRRVTLLGEGYFEVSHNPDKPFEVESNGMIVKAVGTSFNVKAYNDGSDFETTLSTGKVLVQKKMPSGESTICTMRPGQHFKFTPSTNKYSLQSGETFKYLAWKDGRLIFDDDKLGFVAEQLSRWFNVKIILKDSKLKELTYKATFKSEPLSEVLEMMQVVLPIKCVELKRKVTNEGAYAKKEILVYSKKNNDK